MTLALEKYEDQLPHWPASGKHVLAQFDDETVIVYQAYRPSIGAWAAKHGKLGGDFSFSRMTWIKPNFLWMMFRSGWGTKEGQEVTLAIRTKRAGFEEILGQAVASSFGASSSSDESVWKKAVAASDVRLQWDPDHGPSGAALERRAIQLGLRGDTLRRWNDEWIVSIEDVSSIVKAGRGAPKSSLLMPRERVYPVPPAIQARLGM